MRIAIMQPYFFPYVGYFQLMAAADLFVSYDDVTYIKGGWIARNCIWSPAGPQRFGLQLKGRSSYQKICDTSVIPEFEKLKKSLAQNYAKAPFFERVMPLVSTILDYPDHALGNFLTHSLCAVKDYLGLKAEIVQSSQFDSQRTLRGQERVIALCEQLGASHYINLPGGKSLYRAGDFARSGLKLSFIESHPVQYRQFGSHFIPNLSMLDVLMFNSVEQCQDLLAQYDLVCPVDPEATTELISHG